MRELLIEKYENPSEVDFNGTLIWRNRYGRVVKEYNEDVEYFKGKLISAFKIPKKYFNFKKP